MDNGLGLEYVKSNLFETTENMFTFGAPPKRHQWWILLVIESEFSC